ncbi:MAG: DUF3352 domain-containing protein [Chloroflexi bacterium]|nr:DUF3352 domain-containing protein [Chloroflexota bacterium]
MSEQYDYDADDSGSNKNRNIALGIGAGVIIISCVCVIAVGAFLYFDPFGIDAYGWVQSFLGGSDSTAKVMPEDTDFYVSFDVKQLLDSQDFNEIIATFADASGEDFEDFGGLIEIVDEEMDDQMNLTISDDIIPWIGQRIGISVSNISVDQYGGFEGAPDVVFAIEARDRSGADEFIANLIEEIEDQSGMNFDDVEYEGATLYFIDEDFQEFAIGRSDNFVLISEKLDSLEDAIDAQKGDSLADNSAFKDVTNQLPNKRLMTMYINAEVLLELTEASASEFQEFGLIDLNSAPVSGFAMSLAVVPEGLQMDFATAYDSEEMTESQRELLEGIGEATSTDAFFPEDTFFYMSGQGLEMAVDALREALIGTTSQSDFNESMQLFEMQFGFNPDDLLSILSGEFAFGLMSSNEGLFASQMEVPLGFLLLMGTSDEAEMLDMIETINDIAEDQLYMQVDSYNVSGFTLFGLGDGDSESPQIVYGVGEGFLVFASGEGVVEDGFGGGASIADSQRYNDTWDAFPRGSFPVFYLDLEGLYDLMREGMPYMDPQDFNEAIQAIEPLTVIAASSRPLSGNTTLQTIIFFIETE